MNTSAACKADAYRKRPKPLIALVEEWYWNRRGTGKSRDDCVNGMSITHGIEYKHNSISPRITKLLQMGRLVETGEMRETDQSKLGRTLKKTFGAVIIHRDWIKRDVIEAKPQPLFVDGELGRSEAARHFPG